MSKCKVVSSSSLYLLESTIMKLRRIKSSNDETYDHLIIRLIKKVSDCERGHRT